MSSNESESEQSTTELKYLWLFKKVAVRSLLLLLNVYEFAKENSGDFKTAVVSVENVVVSTFGPLYKKLKDLPEKIIVFVDDKFDKYASSDAKNFVTKSQSQIYKTKPLVKKLVTTIQTVIIPLITITIFLLKTTRYLIQSITPKPAPLFGKDQNTHDTILQKGTDLANQAADAAKSLVGGLPLVGNVAQSLTTNPIDLANQIANTTSSLVKENPVLDAVNSAAQNSLDATKSLVPDTILQKGPDLANQAADTTKSLLGGLPLMGNVAQSLPTNQAVDTTKSLLGGLPVLGNVAQSLPTNPADLANQIANTTNSLVKENPVLDTVNSAAQNTLDTANSIVGGLSVVGDVAQSLPTNPADLANQIANTANSLAKENPLLDAVNSAAQNSLDTASSIVGGLPVVGDVAQSLPTNPADLANQILNTTNSLVNDNPLLGAINSAAENIGMKPGATGTKAALQAAYMTMKLAGIPVIAQLWYEVTNKYPTVAAISEFILPVVECMCVLYNKAVTFMDEKGHSIAGYLPLVPIDEMKAAYKLVKTSRDSLAAVGDLIGVDANKGLSAVGDLLGANKNK